MTGIKINMLHELLYLIFTLLLEVGTFIFPILQVTKLKGLERVIAQGHIAVK